MTSNFTRKIEDNDDYTFEDFVWRCARGIGYLAGQRDTDLDAPIKIPSNRSTYYEDSLKSDKEELALLLSTGGEKWEEKNRKEFKANKKRLQKDIEKSKKLKVKFDAMKKKLDAWKVPTEEHEGLKRLMTEQLEQGIKYDCNSDYSESAIKKKYDYSFNEAVEDLKQSIERNEQRIKTEKKSNEKGINYIRELVKSVGNPSQNKEKLFKDI